MELSELLKAVVLVSFRCDEGVDVEGHDEVRVLVSFRCDNSFFPLRLDV